MDNKNIYQYGLNYKTEKEVFNVLDLPENEQIDGLLEIIQKLDYTIENLVSEE